MLDNKKVLVAGCGGLGGYIVEMTARLGVGTILVCDGDCFSQSNMNRQLYCTVETIGKPKALCAENRWPGQVTAFCSFIDKSNAAELISGCDAVIDALDNAESRLILLEECENQGIPFVHGAIGDTNIQVCAITPGNRDILDYIYKGRTTGKTATFSYTPACCASMQVALAHKILKGEEIDSRTLYIADLDSMDFEELKL